MVVHELIGINTDVTEWGASTLGLGVEVIIQLVINPSLEPDRRLQMPQWHLVLCGIISFYFGARS